MKKKVLKLLGLMLILCMMFAAVGCSNDDKDSSDDDDVKVEKEDDKDEDKDEEKEEEKEDTIVGAWVYVWDTTDMMAELMTGGEEEVAKYFNYKDLTMEMVFEFKEDGKVVASLDEDSIEDLVDKFYEQTMEGMKAYLEAAAVERGYASASELVAEAGYASVDAYLEESMGEESMDKESLKEDMLSEYEDREAIYEIDGNKLYVDEEEIDKSDYFVIELDGDEMTWTERVGGEDDETFATMLPMEFERQ